VASHRVAIGAAVIIIAHSVSANVLVIVGPLFLHVVGNTNTAVREARDSTRHCPTLRPNSSVTLGRRVASMLLAGGAASFQNRACPSSAIVSWQHW
jgi:hypothetical protein